VKKVNLGVIGLGGIFQVRHAAALRTIPEVRIEMVSDIDEDVAARTAAEQGCRCTTDCREVATDPKVDAVLVCTPPFVHEEAASAAARAGKHVLCEKPLAPTLAGCDAIIAAAQEGGGKLMVAENWLFDPLTEYVERSVSDGLFGELRRVSFLMGWSGPGRPRFYRSPRSGRNGVFLEDGIHMIAMARNLLGPVRSVTATSRTLIPQRQLGDELVESEVEDQLTAIAEFDGGSGTFQVDWTENVGGLHCEFHGERGYLTTAIKGWDKIESFGVVSGPNGPEPFPAPEFPPRAPVSQSSYEREIRLFVDAILNDAPVAYPAEEGREDVRILELIYDAAESGRTIRC